MEEIVFHHTLPIQLRFNDVDKFGHVNNTVYFSFYDLGKTEYFASVCPGVDWEKMGIVVVHIENGIFVECSTKKTTVYRTVGYESDTQFPAYIQHAVLLHESVHEVIFALYGREWTYGMCLTDCICAYLYE